MFLRSDIRSDAQTPKKREGMAATVTRGALRTKRKESEKRNSGKVVFIGWDMRWRMWDNNWLWLIERWRNHTECIRNCVERDGIRTLFWRWMLVSLLLNNESRQCRHPKSTATANAHADAKNSSEEICRTLRENTVTFPSGKKRPKISSANSVLVSLCLCMIVDLF